MTKKQRASAVAEISRLVTMDERMKKIIVAQLCASALPAAPAEMSLHARVLFADEAARLIAREYHLFE